MVTTGHWRASAVGPLAPALACLARQVQGSGYTQWRRGRLAGADLTACDGGKHTDGRFKEVFFFLLARSSSVSLLRGLTKVSSPTEGPLQYTGRVQSKFRARCGVLVLCCRCRWRTLRPATSTGNSLRHSMCATELASAAACRAPTAGSAAAWRGSARGWSSPPGTGTASGIGGCWGWQVEHIRLPMAVAGHPSGPEASGRAQLPGVARGGAGATAGQSLAGRCPYGRWIMRGHRAGGAREGRYDAPRRVGREPPGVLNAAESAALAGPHGGATSADWVVRGSSSAHARVRCAARRRESVP